MSRVRYVAPAIAIILMVGAAVGAFSAPQREQAAASGYTIVDGYPKYDPPITITRNMTIAIGGETTFYRNNSVDNNAYTQWFRDKMGIIFSPKWVAPDQETDTQRLNLAMASGDLPDLIRASGRNFIDLATGGALLEARSLFDQYASPLVNYVYDEIEEATGLDPFIMQTVGGTVYGIPLVLDVWAGAHSVTWIRQDVLDELRMPVPRSLEDLERVFDAYLQRYPENSPFYLENDWGIPYKWFDTISFNMGAGPSGSGVWLEYEPGTLGYSSIQPEMKAALGRLAQWYQKGYISPEFLTARGNRDLIAGKSMAVFGPWWYIHNVFTDVVKNNPGTEFIPLPLFAEADPNARYVYNAKVLGDGYGISVKARHPEAILLAYNENVESKLRDQEDLRELFPFKYDADVYGKTGGYRVPGPFFFNFPTASNQTEIDSVWLNPSMGINQRVSDLYNTYARIADHLAAGRPDSELSENDLAMKIQVDERLNADAHWEATRLFDREFAAGLHVYSKFFGSPTPTQIERGGELRQLEQETFTKIILGQVPISEFDSFVSAWKARGGDAITREVNDWYRGLGK
ncbi:MAG: extracellular solute-binding protein [Spirochaetaceae bacterium]|nr:MAG: extracellular solute-binding protein [Spirochaetaceae bacterium]